MGFDTVRFFYDIDSAILQPVTLPAYYIET